MVVEAEYDLFVVILWRASFARKASRNGHPIMFVYRSLTRLETQGAIESRKRELSPSEHPATGAK